MAAYCIESRVEDEWTHYEVICDGDVVATARWHADNGVAIIHNEVLVSSPGTIRAVRNYLRDVVIPDVKNAGCTTLCTAGSIDSKMIRYWRLMGFDRLMGFMEV